MLEPDDFQDGKKPKGKRPKPFTIEWRIPPDKLPSWMSPKWAEWAVLNRYATERDRDQAFEVISNPNRPFNHFEYRRGDTDG